MFVCVCLCVGSGVGAHKKGEHAPSILPSKSTRDTFWKGIAAFFSGFFPPAAAAAKGRHGAAGDGRERKEENTARGGCEGEEEERARKRIARGPTHACGRGGKGNHELQ